MQWSNPLKKFFPQREKPDYFLSLILRDRRVEALVFEKVGEKGQVLGRASENTPSSIDEVDQVELVEIVDRAISRAEENLPANVFTSKTILCLKDNWVTEGKIKKEYVPILKKLKEDLELTFLGFVVTTEAICHLLQKEEGVPPTTILVGREGDLLTLALIRAGNIAGVVTRSIAAEKESQVLLGMLRTFKDYEILPSRIILFDNDTELEDLKQQLISFPWTKTLPFLHFPKIEILEANFIQRAVIFGFATQMGVEFDQALSKEEKKEEKEEKALEEEEVGEAFGFMKERDVLTQPAQAKQDKHLNFKPKIKMPKLDIRLPNLVFLKNIKLPLFPSFPPIKFMPIIAVGFLILVALLLLYLFLPKATITLYVNPKTLELTRSVTIDPGSETNLSTGKIKGAIIEAEVSDSQDAQTTGKKEVGEKAKGEVTIYNSSTEMRTFSAGTIITGSNNLKFSLDDKVAVASASGDVFSGTTPSKVKTGITAVQIGEEGNLPSGTTFNIANATNAAAKNDNALSGGSKKQVTVVSRQDQDNLTKALLDKLVQKAKEGLVKNQSSEQKIVDSTLSQEIIEKKLSHQVDKETSKFSLALKVKFKMLGFSQQEMTSLFEAQVKEAIPPDFVLKTGGLDFSFGKTKFGKDKSVAAEVFLRATLLPKIDEKDIKNKVKGKSIDKALNIAGAIANVSDYKIKISPVFPILPKRMPDRRENIKITIVENVQ